LLYESMLDTVLFARDKWLNAGGLIFPDRASIYLCAIEDSEYRQEKIEFWNNVYGFDMSAIKKLALIEPLVDNCNANQIISDAVRILDIDIYTVTKGELDFTSNFQLSIGRNDYAHAFVAYFNVEFSKCHTRTGFSTGPRSRYTHWKQTVFYLNDPIPVSTNDNIHGTISVKRNDRNPRDIDIEISHMLENHPEFQGSQKYHLR